MSLELGSALSVASQVVARVGWVPTGDLQEPIFAGHLGVEHVLAVTDGTTASTVRPVVLREPVLGPLDRFVNVLDVDKVDGHLTPADPLRVDSLHRRLLPKHDAVLTGRR